MATVSFSTDRRNAMIVAAEGRLLTPALLNANYRLASDDGAKSVAAGAGINTAVGELINAGLLKQNLLTGKIELTSSGRTTLSSWAGRAY